MISPNEAPTDDDPNSFLQSTPGASKWKANERSKIDLLAREWSALASARSLDQKEMA